MNTHIRIVASLWGVSGAAFAGWSTWGLTMEEHSFKVVTVWLLVLGFALLALLAAVSFGRAGVIGRFMVRLVSVLALAYSVAWLLLGGVDDAFSYLPGVVYFVALSAYGLVIASREARAA